MLMPPDCDQGRDSLDLKPRIEGSSGRCSQSKGRQRAPISGFGVRV